MTSCLVGVEGDVEKFLNEVKRSGTTLQAEMPHSLYIWTWQGVGIVAGVLAHMLIYRPLQ